MKIEIILSSIFGIFIFSNLELFSELNQTPSPGKETYETYCIACHQADGKGQPGVNPPLVGSDWIIGDKTKLIKTVLQGLNEPIEVKGIKYTNAMPAHDYLEDTELASVLTYVRQNFGQLTDSVTVAEVKSVRESIK